LGKNRKELPNLEDLIDIAGSRCGSAIHEASAIEACGLKLRKGNADWIWRNRKHGEITILNPGRGSTLHSVFYFRDEDGKIYLINSLMPDDRELEGVFSEAEMVDFMPMWNHHRRGYYFEEGLK